MSDLVRLLAWAEESLAGPGSILLMKALGTTSADRYRGQTERIVAEAVPGAP